MDDIVLETHELIAGYGEIPVVKGASVRAWRGKISVIVGPNGSGKSTLMKAIMGINTPDSGTVRAGGDEVPF